MFAHAARIVRPLLVAVFLLLLLQAAEWLDVLPLSLPPPAALAAALGRDAGLLLANTLVTLQAAVIGYAIAILGSAVLIALVAFLPRLEAVVYNAALVMHTLPLIVIAPILVIWFGLGIETRVIISSLSAYYAILIGGLNGLHASAGRAQELMHVLSASKWQAFTKVTVPYALPALFAGLKVGSAGAILGAVVAEWAGAETGLGVMMSNSLFSFQVERVWLTMLMMMIVSVVVYFSVQQLERRVLRWTRPASEAA